MRRIAITLTLFAVSCSGPASGDGCPPIDSPGECSADMLDRVCTDGDVTMKCDGARWVFPLTDTGMAITPGTADLTLDCPPDSGLFDALYACGAELSDPRYCCNGNRATVRVTFTDQRITAVSVLSVYFPCGGWRAPDSWADPFLACLNDQLIRMKLSCDLAEVDIELGDPSWCFIE